MAGSFAQVQDIMRDGTVVFFSFLALVILVPSLASYWYKLRVKEWEASLKHSMLERGMSAEEIKMVLEATAREGTPRGHNHANSSRAFKETIDHAQSGVVS
jgi:hypothetical protein